MGFRDVNWADVGSQLITSAATTGHWWRLQFLTSLNMFTSITDLSDPTGGLTYMGMNFPYGMTIDGCFTRVNMASGAVIAYKAGREIL